MRHLTAARCGAREGNPPAPPAAHCAADNGSKGAGSEHGGARPPLGVQGRWLRPSARGAARALRGPAPGASRARRGHAVYDRPRPAALRPGCLNQRMPRPRRALGLTVAALAARSFTMEGWAWSRAACRAAQQEARAFREWGAAPHAWSDERRAPSPTCGDWDRVCQQEAQRHEARLPAPRRCPRPRRRAARGRRGR